MTIGYQLKNQVGGLKLYLLLNHIEYNNISCDKFNNI